MNLKDFEGKEVYLRPTGNNARRYRNERFLVARIIKVARVNVTLVIGSSPLERKMRFDGDWLSDCSNSGYVAYDSIEKVNGHYESEKIAREIAENFRYTHDLVRLGIDKLRAIKDIIDS